MSFVNFTWKYKYAISNLDIDVAMELRLIKVKKS